MLHNVRDMLWSLDYTKPSALQSQNARPALPAFCILSTLMQSTHVKMS